MRTSLALAAIAIASAIAAGGCSKAQFGASVGREVAESDFPRLQAGFWQSTMRCTTYRFGVLQLQADEFPAARRCHVVDSLEPNRLGVCSRFSLGRTPDGAFVADMECKDEVGVTRGRETLTGDFGRRFTQNTWMQDIFGHNLFDLDLTNCVTEWEKLGPCPTGTQPRSFNAD